MTKIELLMRELNLNDTIINQTLYKINHICAKYNYESELTSSRLFNMNGNGDGNGGNN